DRNVTGVQTCALPIFRGGGGCEAGCRVRVGVVGQVGVVADVESGDERGHRLRQRHSVDAIGRRQEQLGLVRADVGVAVRDRGGQIGRASCRESVGLWV